MASAPVVEISSLLVSRAGYREGRPCLRGTGITVHQVGGAYLRGYTAEQICSFNPHIDASIVHAALAYFLANRERLEAEMEADIRDEREMAALYPEGITPESLPF